jgi:putative membrane protein
MWCPGMTGGGGMMGGGAWILLIGVLGLLMLVALAAAGVVLVRRPSGSAAPKGDSQARTVLDLRFARGEIDAEDYRQRRSMIADQAPGAAEANHSR